LKSGFVLRQRGPPAPGDICGYVHAFLIAQIKPKDAKDNLLRYFKGNPQGGRCKQISLFEKVATWSVSVMAISTVPSVCSGKL
jgi:hypothetical protein